MNRLQRKANEFLQRADDLTALLRRLSDGDASALPQLTAQCASLPYDGQVWRLRVEDLLVAHDADTDEAIDALKGNGPPHSDADAILDIEDDTAPPGVDVLDVITPR